MTFDLVPTLAIFSAYAVIAIAVIAGLAAIALLGDFAVRNHKLRVQRNESIPAYYRGLVLSH